jgi:GrpB-like predicted nucleotidyltransferase (UPF0157 family)
MLGLKRGTVALLPHQVTWEENAKETIAHLWTVLEGIAVDIQHIGSTSIRHIHAKPIIDLAVGVHSLDDITPFIPQLDCIGVKYRNSDHPGQQLFVMGEFENEIRTHHVHVVEIDNPAWQNYINFRDYLNDHPEKAKLYDDLKQTLLQQHADNRGFYTAGKQELITNLLEEARQYKQGQ